MLYIIQKTFIPNTAPSNRLLAYAKGLSELGVDATFVAFTPDQHFSVCKIQLPHIRFKYYWQTLYFKGDKTKYISFFIYAVLFALRLRKGDKVLFYGAADYMKLVLSLKKRVDYYVEKTEFPENAMLKTRFGTNSITDYLHRCRKAKGVFVISTALKEYFIEKGVSPDKVLIVNMTVDTGRFKDLRKETCERYIAYCGAADNSKDGVDCLIKSFAIVSKKYPDVKLYIIGPLPDNPDANANIRLTEELGIADRVVFTGLVAQNEIPQLLKNAEILALDRPDNIQAKYGFPTKLGEYLLSENPVVLTDVGDISLFLKDGLSAMVSKPDNEEEFAEKINMLLCDKGLRGYIGTNGAKVAKECFNYLNETKKIINFIQNN